MNYKFGRRPVVSDERTIRLSSILKPLLLPALPSNFDNDVALNGIDDEFVYNNSKYGDCVIASRAHHTLRFEKFEQGTQIFISDEEVVNEYFDQSGGLDRGLVLLFSLNDWKNDGWDIGIRHYEVYAYAKVDVDNHNEAKHAIHLLNGLNIGVQIYDKDLTQMDNGEVWDITDDDGSLRGGHGIYIYAYDEEGLWCMTWGKRQKMTWKWWDYRVDEAYAIVDDVNEWMYEYSPLDVEKLNGYLKEICGNGDLPIPSDCPVTKSVVATFNFLSKNLGRKSRIKSYVDR